MSVNAINNTTANVYTGSQTNTTDKNNTRKNSSQRLKVQGQYIKNQKQAKRQPILLIR